MCGAKFVRAPRVHGFLNLLNHDSQSFPAVLRSMAHKKFRDLTIILLAWKITCLFILGFGRALFLCLETRRISSKIDQASTPPPPATPPQCDLSLEVAGSQPPFPKVNLCLGACR